MSEFTDSTLGRYLDRQPGMRQALLTDPVQCAQTELLRRTLDALERGMTDEGVDEEARRRVINRVVWGDPHGVVDAYAETRERVAELHRKLPWTSPSYGAGPVRPDEEPT